VLVLTGEGKGRTAREDAVVVGVVQPKLVLAWDDGQEAPTKHDLACCLCAEVVPPSL